MNIDIELEASDLRALDEHDRRRQQHQLQHWHPLDPERLDADFKEPPEQEISLTSSPSLKEGDSWLLPSSFLLHSPLLLGIARRG
jgi:hypothetical protein